MHSVKSHISFPTILNAFDQFENKLVSRHPQLPWPSGYELRLSLERSWVLILVKVIGGRQEGHPVQKCSLLQKSPN